MTQHIVCQIISLGLLAYTDLNSLECIMSQMQDDVLDAIMTTCTALLADTELSHIQADIIIDNDKFTLFIYLIVVYSCTDCLSAQVHISKWL